MKYGIALFPSKKLQDLANSYRKRYDPHYSLIPPHLTLKGPFEASEEEIQGLADKLKAIAHKHQPVRLHVSKVKSFEPVNNVIYLKVDPTDELEQLHQDLNSNLPEDSVKYTFVPHLTIAQGLSNDEHSDIYGSLKMLAVDHEETVDRFHLVYQLENGSWTVYETFLLGKE
ncbi:MAG TPA: YjcG family protein [Chondromyces sp.]|nr:YjcG family protein [Chondromyces sp.]